MVKPPTFDSNGMKKGAWSKQEDVRLRAFVMENGHNNWRLLPLLAGLARCGKSCRLRWVNYLKPGLKREKFTKQEEDLIIKLHNQLGNKWSAMAAKFPGRTDNEIKNYWHAYINKRGRRCNNDIIKAQTPQEAEVSSSSSPSSSPSPSSVTTDHDQHQEDSPANNMDALNPIADEELDTFHDFESFAQICTDHFPPFPVEELDTFHDFESLFQEMRKDLSDNFSDGGSCSSNISAEFQGNLWSESFGDEDVFDIELW